MRSALLILLFLTLAGAGSCSPTYVFKAAYEESKILLAREKISTVIKDPETSEEEKIKLEHVVKVRTFAESIALTPGDSFTRYTKVDRDVLAWVLMASRKDAFALASWWYPIVGTVPYNGYFEEAKAHEAAKELEKDGLETWVRGTEAFSTLGWFNDPILSTTLKHTKPEITNTVIHEILHSTIWIPDHVAFNESLANFVGTQGSVDFYKSEYSQCIAKSLTCESELNNLRLAQKNKERVLELSLAIDALYKELTELYESDISSEEKIAKREVIFKQHTGELKKKYPQMKMMQTMNNAAIMQLKVYMTELPAFNRLFIDSGSHWSAFLKQIEAIKEQAKDKDPFELLEARTAQSK